jgi:mono/diheme cytochrome c family protein
VREMHKSVPLIFILVAAAIWFMPLGCDYGRMYDQDSVKTYERKALPADGRTVPVTDGYQTLLAADPQGLKNPFGPTAENVAQGRLAYGYYCVQCHGPRLDGNGTVGQSFSPLPADLMSDAVLSQYDGALYEKIRTGFRRHPPLFATISPEDTWSVLVYLRSRRGSE